MRVQPHGVGSIMHVIKRGTRGMDIVRDDADCHDFKNLLFYTNDAYMPEHRRREAEGIGAFTRPENWPERKPLTHVLAWTLMPNHFHLILQELQENGIAKFMQRLGGSMSLCFNAKYSESGSLFQGGYKGIRVDTDAYLRYLTAYVLVKNVFELYPRGLKQAVQHFNDAWKFSLEYQFSSLRTIACAENSSIVEHGLLRDMYTDPKDFKQQARDMCIAHLSKKDDEMLFLTLE
ncbi:transposase [Candidatus Kaiserbacteria bacterium]|nr:transposase [Candidatus Kaiserbacteria bacterium]